MTAEAANTRPRAIDYAFICESASTWGFVRNAVKRLWRRGSNSFNDIIGANIGEMRGAVLFVFIDGVIKTELVTTTSAHIVNYDSSTVTYVCVCVTYSGDVNSQQFNGFERATPIIPASEQRSNRLYMMLSSIH